MTHCFSSGETIKIKWNYIDNDVIVKEFILNIYDSDGKIVKSEKLLPSARDSQVALEKGVYNIEIIARGANDTTNNSDSVVIRVSNFKNRGIVRTINIEPGQLLSKILIKTKCEIPQNTNIIGRIYYKKDDNDN